MWWNSQYIGKECWLLLLFEGRGAGCFLFWGTSRSSGISSDCFYCPFVFLKWQFTAPQLVTESFQMCLCECAAATGLCKCDLWGGITAGDVWAGALLAPYCKYSSPGQIMEGDLSSILYVIRMQGCWKLQDKVPVLEGCPLAHLCLWMWWTAAVPFRLSVPPLQLPG